MTNILIDKMKIMMEEHEKNPFKVIDITEEKLNTYRIYDTKLIDLECKHIAKITSNNKVYVELAAAVSYEWVVLGSHRNSSITDEINRIKEMADSKTERPIRIVITEDGRLWADNTHWTLAYIQKYGDDIKVKDVPFYIVNLDSKFIYSYSNSVTINKKDIDNVIQASYDIQHRLNNGWRRMSISYKIKDLMAELSNCESSEGLDQALAKF